MASDTAAKLLVRIEATAEQLRREMKSADKAVGKHEKTVADRLAKTRKQFNDSAKKVAKWGAAVGAAATAAGVAMVKSGLSSVDALAKTSSKLGIATEDLSKLRFAAEQTGVQTKTLDMALQRMTRRVSEAAKGTGEAVKALDELGLNAKELNDLAPDKVFKRVSAAMKDVESPADRLRLAFKLFDSEGAALVNTLGLTADQMAELEKQAESAGIVISEEMAAKVELANDSINKSTKLFDGFSQQVAVQFAPMIQLAADKLFAVGTGSSDMESLASAAFEKIIRAVGFVGDAFRGLEIIFLTLKAGVQSMAIVILQSFENILRAASNAASLIPGVNIDYETSTFKQFFDDFKENTFDTARAIQEKLNEELPSDKFERFAEEANAALETIPTKAEEVSQSLELITVSAQRVEKNMEQFSVTMDEESEKASESVTENSAAMAENVRRGFERMRDGVGDFFKNMIVDGKASFSGLLDMFKGVIAEMVATAASNRIMLSLGIGGASAGAAASGGGGAGSAGGLLSSIGGGIQGLGSGALNFAGEGLFQLGRLTGSETLVEGAGSFFNAGNNLTTGGAIAGIGGGIAGGFASNAVFGETSGIGNTLGGLAGQALIPIPGVGAAIGSFLGGGVESLFGGDNNGDNSGVLAFGPGGGTAQGVGKSFNEANVEQAQKINDSLLGLAESIGGSVAEFEVKVGNNTGISLDGESFKEDVDGFFSEAFDRIVQGAHDLSEPMKQLVIDFDGTADQAAQFAQVLVSGKDKISKSGLELIDSFNGTAAQATRFAQVIVSGKDQITESGAALIESFDGSAAQTTAFAHVVMNGGIAVAESSQTLIEAFQGTEEKTFAYAQSLMGLMVALDTDPVQAARDSYAATGTTLTQSYADQTQSLNDLIGRYDGSLAATERLSSELQTNKQMAFQLAQQLLAASGQIENLTASSAESIRQSVMSEQELRDARRAELNSLVEELEVLSDPAKIKGTVSQIEQLNKQVFDSLGPEKQKEQAESFAGFIEKVNTTAQGRLDEAIGDLERQQMEINASLGDTLDEAAAKMQSASSGMNSAASAMQQAAASIPSTFNVNVSSTVNVSRPDIPGFASGGLARPGLAMVGEEGPELVRFNKPGMVHNASETRAMLSGGDSKEVGELRREVQALAIMQSKQLKLWQRVTRDGESLRTTAA